MAYKIFDTKPFPKDQINLSNISYLLLLLVWMMCLCFLILETFISMLFGSGHPKDYFQTATQRLDGRKRRVLPYRSSSLQFLVWYGEMKTYSRLLWVIIHHKRGLRLSFLPVREINTCLKHPLCWWIARQFLHHKRDELTWGRSRGVWRMVFCH